MKHFMYMTQKHFQFLETLTRENVVPRDQYTIKIMEEFRTTSYLALKIVEEYHAQQ